MIALPGIYRPPAGQHHHTDTVEITTVWNACGSDVYQAPAGTAAAFYGVLLLIAVLVIALWAWARKREHG